MQRRSLHKEGSLGIGPFLGEKEEQNRDLGVSGRTRVRGMQKVWSATHMRTKTYFGARCTPPVSIIILSVA